MRIPIVKDGFRFILPLGLLTAACLVFSMVWGAWVFGLLFLFCTWFFRDPERPLPHDPKAVLSPADGKIVEVKREKDPLLDQPVQRISIFLSVFNVHVNRIPIHGRIEKTVYHEGKFLAAFNHKASLDNERNTLLIIREDGVEVVVRQIAGLIARRIVCWAREGEEYQAGQRFGLIRFGSRVDLLVPEKTRLMVTRGQHVKGGSSIIGMID